MIGFVEVALGTGGGVRCARCHGEPDAVSYASAAEVEAAIGRAVARSREAGGPGPNVALAGPEPFAHPELPAVVAASMRAGVRRLRLDTSGAGLLSPANAAGVLGAGVRHIRVVLLGGTPGVHDALAGVPGAFDAALAGARAFREVADAAGERVSVVVHVPACRHNLRETPAAVAAAVEAGADAVTIALSDGGADLEPSLAWLRSACDTGVVNGVWVEVVGVPFCLLREHALHVADVARPRGGDKAPACAACDADAVCGGLAAGACADQMALLAPPADAASIADGVVRARGEASTRG